MEVPALTEEERISVFINCPFDSEFEPIFDAILFATVCCGFLPRSALESGTVAIPRVERICKALLGSRYSIHDLSRCQGEGTEDFARFNMPLELGMAMVRRFIADDIDEAHDWLVLVPVGHSYLRFVSDLAGYDPRSHVETVESVVPPVMSWLLTRPDAVATRSINPRVVLAALPRFLSAKEQLVAEWGREVPWQTLVEAARVSVPS